MRCFSFSLGILKFEAIIVQKKVMDVCCCVPFSSLVTFAISFTIIIFWTVLRPCIKIKLYWLFGVVCTDLFNAVADRSCSCRNDLVRRFFSFIWERKSWFFTERWYNKIEKSGIFIWIHLYDNADIGIGSCRNDNRDLRSFPWDMKRSFGKSWRTDSFSAGKKPWEATAFKAVYFGWSVGFRYSEPSAFPKKEGDVFPPGADSPRRQGSSPRKILYRVCKYFFSM